MTSNVERLTVTLTTEMAHAVRGAVGSGAYASSSEVIREALRDWQHKRQLQEQQLAELRADVKAGLDDVEAGRVRDFDAERIIQRGRAKLADRSSSA
ncbi:MAG: type II toxin-antitoxin system ParD family antitoxin [Nitrospirota bacterium]|nr:type II toxin-antitoxin system ParD family antitoxin [Nitrospirota bacterium]